MSFQRKNQVLNRNPVSRPGVNRPVPANPARGAPSFSRNSLVSNTNNNGPISGRGPIPGRGSVPGRLPALGQHPVIPGAQPLIGTSQSSLTSQPTQPQTEPNPAVKPSIVTSEPAISTGCSDLDKLLLHGGLPVGSSLIFEETGSTDYSLVLLKYFATQGVLHNRIDNKSKNSNSSNNCHVVVIGANPALWLKELPGVYKGSRREIKKQQIRENESKLSVKNIIDGGASARNSTTTSVNGSTNEGGENKANKLKIAWRYGLKDAEDDKNTDLSNVNYPHYNHTFDITTRLVPSPSTQEITFLQIPQIPQQSQKHPSEQQQQQQHQKQSLKLLNIYKQLETIVKNQTHNGTNGKIVRVVIPHLLNPSIYSPELFNPCQILPFLQLLKTLTSKYSKNLTIVSSISLDLFAPDLDSDTSIPANKSALVAMVEKIFDSVVQLCPFNQSLIRLLELSYKNQPNKIQQGFMNILKISNLSDRGAMIIKMNEYAFRNGKRNFEITEWSIPVDNDEVDDRTKEIHDAKPEQTAKSIEF